MELTERARSSSFSAELFSEPSLLKMVPVPSSLMVAVPVAVEPPVLVASSLKVSLLSLVASSTMAVRTSACPLESRVMLDPAV